MKMKIKLLLLEPEVTALPVSHFLYGGQDLIFHLLVHQKSLGADLLLRDMSGQSQEEAEKSSGDHQGSPPG